MQLLLLTTFATGLMDTSMSIYGTAAANYLIPSSLSVFALIVLLSVFAFL